MQFWQLKRIQRAMESRSADRLNVEHHKKTADIHNLSSRDIIVNFFQLYKSINQDVRREEINVDFLDFLFFDGVHGSVRFLKFFQPVRNDVSVIET